MNLHKLQITTGKLALFGVSLLLGLMIGRQIFL